METATIIPLGYRCTTTLILTTLKLSDVSLPFDWIVSTIDQVIATLESNFKDMVRQEDIFSSTPSIINHVRYYLFTNKYGAVFPHLLDGKLTVSEQSTSALEKMNRRYTRFLEIVNGTKPVIFTLYYDRVDKVSLKLDDIIKLYNFLQNRYPGLKFGIVAIQDNPTVELKREHPRPNLVLATGDLYYDMKKQSRVSQLFHELLTTMANLLAVRLPLNLTRGLAYT